MPAWIADVVAAVVGGVRPQCREEFAARHVAPDLVDRHLRDTPALEHSVQDKSRIIKG